jgi:exopolysaccharide biosynthesis polyprenyl glycosylphosphotransferase
VEEAGGGRCAAICQPWPFVWILSSDRGRRQNGGEGIQRPERPTMVIREERLPAAQPDRASGPNRDFVLRRLLAAADAGGIVIALAISIPFFGRGGALSGILWGLVTLPAWILIFKLYGLYDRDAKRVSHSTVDDLPWLFHSLVIGSVGLWLFFEYVAPTRVGFTEGVVFFGAALVGIFVLRALARGSSRLIIAPERVLLVGGGPMAELLARKIRLHPEYELDPVGYVDAVEDEKTGLSYLGDLSDVDLICHTEEIERVLILSPELSPDELADLIRRLRGIDVHIGILPRAVDVLGTSVEVDDVEGITVLGVTSPTLTRSSRLVKRVMDISIASLLLILLAPVFLVIAIAIKLSSSGPVFHRQRRIGQGGRSFRIVKFRTMVKDAEMKGHELAELSAHPVWLLLENDPRITRVGRFLRHWSLDEIPQLWNVLRGEMSLVGPRPMPPSVDEHISGWGRRRLDLTPGITGLWQVLGRTTISFEEMVKLDYLYVTNWSLWQDIRLLIHTLPAVLGRRGVN